MARKSFCNLKLYEQPSSSRAYSYSCIQWIFQYAFFPDRVVGWLIGFGLVCLLIWTCLPKGITCSARALAWRPIAAFLSISDLTPFAIFPASARRSFSLRSFCSNKCNAEITITSTTRNVTWYSYFFFGRDDNRQQQKYQWAQIMHFV